MKPKRFFIPTPQSLAFAAARYLERYAASEASVRRVLENRLRRAALQNPAFAADEAAQRTLQQAIDAILAKHTKAGVLNDASFAEIKVNSLRRQGRSRRAIAQKLAAQGVSATLVAEALTRHAQENDDEDAEFTAAVALARRRKWGAFRTRPGDEVQTRKALAAMLRAGFSLTVARRALQAPPDEDEA